MDNGNININVPKDAVLDMEVAMPLGMILNELISILLSMLSQKIRAIFSLI